MKKLIAIAIGIFILNDMCGALTLDLATTHPGEKFSQTIEPQLIDLITLENTLLDGRYSISIEEQRMPTNPLSIQNTDDVKRDECPLKVKFEEIEKGLNVEKSEKGIKKLKGDLTDLIKKADKNSCSVIIQKANDLISKTNRICLLTKPINLEKGEMVMITVQRDTFTWVFTFKTKIENPWSVMYGFTYVSNWLNRTDHFFSKADTANTYIITKQNIHKTDSMIFKNITPTVMFTYKSTEKYHLNSKDWFKAVFSNYLYQIGLTGGISLDLSNPTAMISPSIIFGDNLSINLGLIFTQKDVLIGDYKEGDRIKTYIPYSQLHEKQYMPDFFLSLAFRFDKNIFSSSGSTTTK